MTYTEKKAAVLAYLTRQGRFCSPTDIAGEALGNTCGQSTGGSAVCKKMVKEGLLEQSEIPTPPGVRRGWYRIKK